MSVSSQGGLSPHGLTFHTRCYRWLGVPAEQDHTQPRTPGWGWARAFNNHLSRAWDEARANARHQLRLQAHSQRPSAPQTETGWETGSRMTNAT